MGPSVTRETERVTVKSYVPAYQRENWREHADRLNMSLSEFVRTMTQAGRRSFEMPAASAETSDGDGSSDDDPTGERLEETVLDHVEETGGADWDALVATATDDLEDRLDEALERLQAENRLRYSGRAGGYVPVDR